MRPPKIYFRFLFYTQKNIYLKKKNVKFLMPIAKVKKKKKKKKKNTECDPLPPI